MIPLLDRSDSLLAVIDVQPGFLTKLPQAVADETVDRIRWLTQAAVALDVPVLVTEEAVSVNGTTVEPVQSALPEGNSGMDKLHFGLAEQPDLLARIQEAACRTVVVCGLETDVCVVQSALGLLSRGYDVAVAVDAVASPGTGHELGLARMHEAGVAAIGVKGIVYEWLRTVERTTQLDAVLENQVPPGVVL